MLYNTMFGTQYCLTVQDPGPRQSHSLWQLKQLTPVVWAALLCCSVVMGSAAYIIYCYTHLHYINTALNIMLYAAGL